MPNQTTNETSASASESRPSAKSVRLLVKNESRTSAMPIAISVHMETHAAFLASLKTADLSKKWLWLMSKVAYYT